MAKPRGAWFWAWSAWAGRSASTLQCQRDGAKLCFGSTIRPARACIGSPRCLLASTCKRLRRLPTSSTGFARTRSDLTAHSQLAAIRHLSPVSLARFVLLTAAGAAALGVIFGATYWLTLVLIAFSA